MRIPKTHAELTELELMDTSAMRSYISNPDGLTDNGRAAVAVQLFKTGISISDAARKLGVDLDQIEHAIRRRML